jgi:YggT family protein
MSLPPIIYLLYMTLNLLSFALIVWIIISWLVSFRVLNTSNRFVYAVHDALNRFFEPILRPIRRFMPDLGTIDISPIVLFLLIEFAQYCLVYYF